MILPEITDTRNPKGSSKCLVELEERMHQVQKGCDDSAGKMRRNVLGWSCRCKSRIRTISKSRLESPSAMDILTA